MFYHGFGNYMEHAFPHDELRPLTRTFTNSLVELGNAVRPTHEHYDGVALTLIDALDTLAVLGNASGFAWGVNWVGSHISFDIDVSLHRKTQSLTQPILSTDSYSAYSKYGAHNLSTPPPCSRPTLCGTGRRVAIRD